jgi:CDGSH-type Zn-finger protein
VTGRIRACPDGPLLVDGDVEMTTEDGVVHRSTRPVTAVCRCGASARAPWCDGTHKLLDRGK